MYFMGLDITGAFDRAARRRKIDSPLFYELRSVIRRLIVIWLTDRASRVILATPMGAVSRQRKDPANGGTLGGRFITPALAAVRE